VGEVSSALFGLRDMGLDVPDGDSQAYRFGALSGILAERLDNVYCMLNGYVWDETHPADASPQEEARDMTA